MILYGLLIGLLGGLCFLLGCIFGECISKCNAQTELTPKWKRIKKGERLPCRAYIWSFAFDDKYRGEIPGNLIPNIGNCLIGIDTWYIPQDEIMNLPKE